MLLTLRHSCSFLRIGFVVHYSLRICTNFPLCADKKINRIFTDAVYCSQITKTELLDLPRQCRHLQFTDRLRDLNVTRTGVRAVIDRVAARKTVRFADDLHPFGSGFIAAVEDKAM